MQIKTWCFLIVFNNTRCTHEYTSTNGISYLKDSYKNHLFVRVQRWLDFCVLYVFHIHYSQNPFALNSNKNPSFQKYP